MTLLLEAAVKSSLMIVLAFCLVFALRRRSAALRHMVWSAAILASLVLPLASPVLPSWRIPLFEMERWREAPGWSVLNTTSGTTTPSAPIGAATPRPRGGESGFRITQLAPFVWFALALLMLLHGIVKLARIASGADRLTDSCWTSLASSVSGSSGRVRLLQHRSASMLVTWGFIRPRVLLPAGAAHWSDDRRRVVLAHEFAHIRRADWLIQIVAEIARAIYWFNPLLWIACSRLRQESERACDDIVLNLGVDARDYAAHLLELARTLRRSGGAWLPALAMARQSNLERRFASMLNPNLDRRSVTRTAILLTPAIALGLTLALATLSTAAQNVPGNFYGTIYDPSGAVLPGVTVMLSNPEGSISVAVTSRADGVYEFTGLPPGSYLIDVAIPGFARQRLPVTLPARSLPHNIYMRLGSIKEHITVTAAPPVNPRIAAAPRRIRVGGNIQVSKLIKQVQPVFPPEAQNAGITGEVSLEGLIDVDGTVVALRLLNADVEPSLLKAATDAVSQWRYSPTLLNGQPVQVVTTITVEFRFTR
jgi:TonB family protein